MASSVSRSNSARRSERRSASRSRATSAAFASWTNRICCICRSLSASILAASAMCCAAIASAWRTDLSTSSLEGTVRPPPKLDRGAPRATGMSGTCCLRGAYEGIWFGIDVRGPSSGGCGCHDVVATLGVAMGADVGKLAMAAGLSAPHISHWLRVEKVSHE